MRFNWKNKKVDGLNSFTAVGECVMNGRVELTISEVNGWILNTKKTYCDCWSDITDEIYHGKAFKDPQELIMILEDSLIFWDDTFGFTTGNLASYVEKEL